MNPGKEEAIMKAVWVVCVCVIGLGFVFASGCRMAPEPRVEGYSNALDLQRANQQEEAIEMFQTYIDENPECELVPFARFRIAEAYLAMGDIDSAVESYEVLIENHPDSIAAQWAEEDLAILEENPELLLGPSPVKEVEPDEPEEE